MPEVWVTVSKSQVFNWIKLINEYGISTDCLSITPKKLDRKNVKLIESEIKGDFYQIKNRKLLIIDIFLFMALLKYYVNNIFKYDKIIIQTRLNSIGFTFFILRFFPKIKLVYESRGAGNEERLHSKKMNNGLKAIVKTNLQRGSERLMIYNSSKIIFVSESLKDYYKKRYSKLNDSNLIVFPGAADSELFSFNSELRIKTRNELGFNDNETVYVYSGRLEMKWEIPDKIIEFFNYIYKNKNKNCKLLLITPDVQLANSIINSDLKNRVLIKSCGLEDVNRYLNASDIALLLREDIPMNNVASPTKFAEYLMAGLPVIISHGVHDFADIINNTHFGVVVNNLHYTTDSEYSEIEKSLLINKKEISTWGDSHLSKKVFINNYKTVLLNI